MDSLDNCIDSLTAEVPNRYSNYWLAFAKYRKSLAVIQLFANDKAQKKEGGKVLSEAIRLLEKEKNKSSEDYALLAMLKNLAINYASGVKIPFLSNEAKKYAQLAIDLDDCNPRGYLARGLNDYFTPVMYGGGKLFEADFLRVISLEPSKGGHPYEPNWGRDEAYYYLCIYYKKTRPESVIDLLRQGLNEFPDDRRLNALRIKWNIDGQQ